MTRSARIGIISGILAGVVVLAVVLAVVLRITTTNNSAPTAASAAAGSTAAPLIRNDTHLLGTEGTTGVSVVEFLDFECEACGAFYPVVEDLRKQYAGEVTFAFRYFPLPGHGNSRNAAAAVEAAARQDQLEPMFQRMFDTQPEWGERGVTSQADRFRGYAKDLGLNMERYDRDVVSSRVKNRIQRDVNDGVALGVQSTPTFFVNGRQVELTAYDDLERAIEQALNEAK